MKVSGSAALSTALLYTQRTPAMSDGLTTTSAGLQVVAGVIHHVKVWEALVTLRFFALDKEGVKAMVEAGEPESCNMDWVGTQDLLAQRTYGGYWFAALLESPQDPHVFQYRIVPGSVPVPDDADIIVDDDPNDPGDLPSAYWDWTGVVRVKITEIVRTGAGALDFWATGMSETDIEWSLTHGTDYEPFE